MRSNRHSRGRIHALTLFPAPSRNHRVTALDSLLTAICARAGTAVPEPPQSLTVGASAEFGCATP